MLRSLLILALFACRSSSTRPVEPMRALAGDLVIVDVTVAPMDRDATIPHQTVIVRGDKIAAVAPAASVEIAAGATTIDGAGKWLLPGLADMHVHTWNERDFTMFVAAGVTTVRNMYGSEQHLAWKTAIAASRSARRSARRSTSRSSGADHSQRGNVAISRPRSLASDS